MRAKICGMRDEKDVRTAVEGGADAVGFVTEVTVETPRNLSREEASRLVESVPPFVTTVSVIMPPGLETAVEIAGETGVDAVQVHGGLDPDEVGELRRRTGRKVVTKVGPDVESGTVDEVEENSDGILVDSSDERGGGGTGTTHDWSKSAEIVSQTDTPVILAGGLTPENVPRAVEEVSPYGVDVSSGVENGGGKSADLVERFVSRAKRAGDGSRV